MTSDAVAGNMCPFCRAILGAPHEGWCTHARPDAVPPRVDVSALQSEIERLRAELAEVKRDADRYRWLTYDHDDAEQRKRCREIWDCGCVMSYSALSVDIDAAMAGGEE